MVDDQRGRTDELSYAHAPSTGYGPEAVAGAAPELPSVCQPGQRGRLHELSHAYAISTGFDAIAAEMIERGTCHCGQHVARFVLEGEPVACGPLFPLTELAAVVDGLAPEALGPELLCPTAAVDPYGQADALRGAQSESSESNDWNLTDLECALEAGWPSAWLFLLLAAVLALLIAVVTGHSLLGVAGLPLLIASLALRYFNRANHHADTLAHRGLVVAPADYQPTGAGRVVTDTPSTETSSASSAPQLPDSCQPGRRGRSHELPYTHRVISYEHRSGETVEFGMCCCCQFVVRFVFQGPTTTRGSLFLLDELRNVVDGLADERLGPELDLGSGCPRCRATDVIEEAHWCPGILGAAAEGDDLDHARITAALAELGWTDVTDQQLAELAAADPFSESRILRGARTLAALAELTGHCRTCGQPSVLTASYGRIAHHRVHGATCPGSHRPPVARDEPCPTCNAGPDDACTSGCSTHSVLTPARTDTLPAERRTPFAFGDRVIRCPDGARGTVDEITSSDDEWCVAVALDNGHRWSGESTDLIFERLPGGKFGSSRWQAVMWQAPVRQLPPGYQWRVSGGGTGDLHLYAPGGQNVTTALTGKKAPQDFPDADVCRAEPPSMVRDHSLISCQRPPHATGEHLTVALNGDFWAWSTETGRARRCWPGQSWSP